ncbi:pectinesterase QRT1-like [Nymphaea colorata]|nr:pectinesterase QRT1-like [Nymphaea colorata]
MGSYWFWFCLIFWLLGLGVHWVDCEFSSDYISWDDLNIYDSSLGKMQEWGNREKGRVIVVAKGGERDTTTVQGAVDLVPHGNNQRVKIFIQSGVYREKVLIPTTKPYISFIGDESGETVISWNSTASEKGSYGQPIGTIHSASVAIESDYFCASGITFENSAPSALPGAEGKQAVALRISGDKAMFFRCKVLGSQDTLFDHMGRHYFYHCEIHGAIDFIFGSARSLYESCVLHATAASYGAIAASQRNSPNENSGFSFLQCKLDGSGKLYLGRAWGRYAQVVYSLCDMGDIVIPQGWHDWDDPSRRRTVWFAEYNCRGGGADSRKRVPWSKSLTFEEAKPFLTSAYIDGQQWLRL